MKIKIDICYVCYQNDKYTRSSITIARACNGHLYRHTMIFENIYPGQNAIKRWKIGLIGNKVYGKIPETLFTLTTVDLRCLVFP